MDAHFTEPLQAQTAGDAQGGCQPAGEMAAASRILEAAVFNLGGVIRMTWPGTVGQIGVVSGTGIGIVNDGGNGGAAGKAIQDSRQKFRTVFFLPGGGPIVPAGSTAIQKGLQNIEIYGKSRRDAVQGHADGRPMGLAENG